MKLKRLLKTLSFSMVLLSTVVLDFKIPVIPTPSATHTAKLLVSMCSRKDSPKGPYLKKIKKSSDLEKQQLSILV